MRILVDAYNIALQHGTGVATYGRNFLRAVRDMGHTGELLYGLPIRPDQPQAVQSALLRSRDNPSRGKLLNKVERYLGSARSTLGARAFALPENLGEHGDELPHLPPADVRWNSYRLWPRAIGAFRTLGRPTPLRGLHADIVHWTYPLPVRLAGGRNIYTLHDLVPLTMPEFSLDNRSDYFRTVKYVCDTADHIVTISETSMADITRLFGVDERRITNTYQPHDITPAVKADARADGPHIIEQVCGLRPGEYFIFFGAIEPKKNVARIIEGYLRSHSTTPMVIVAAPGWRSDIELALVDSFGGTPAVDRIRIVEYLPRSVLLTLVSYARATVFPSLSEGFGLPALESMALGTPVITSRLGALNEVAGDAALKVDPFDAQDIAGAIARIDADSDLRANLSARGTARSETFSPAAYQNRLAVLFDRVMAAP